MGQNLVESVAITVIGANLVDKVDSGDRLAFTAPAADSHHAPFSAMAAVR